MVWEEAAGGIRLRDWEWGGRARRGWGRQRAARHGRLGNDASVAAAASAYVEDFPQVIPPETEISVRVCEVESDHEHCFLVALDNGDTDVRLLRQSMFHSFVGYSCRKNSCMADR